MAKIKFSQDLFLEKAELTRFKQFLDDAGWRQNLLQNSLRFGLIEQQYFLSGIVNNEFTNGYVSQGSALSINYNTIAAIDSLGNFISLAAGNLATIADSNWYWVKIKYATSNVEAGTVSIDAQGNLIGTGTAFTQVLRGQPNFPARISFIGSAGNLLEYDVLEVISDTSAILDNNASFSPETNLQYVVVGTFTPASVPSSTDKDIFVYDSCTLSLVLETVPNTPPSAIAGQEFFLARIKNNGSSLIIQDKRTNIWKVKADFFAQNIQQSAIPNFGVEKVKFDDTFSTRDKNIVELAWAFRSINYSVNTNLNIVTINGGQGGKYKTVNDFTNGDFNGYRLYTKDGSYSIIKTSIKTGGQINLTLDVLDVNLYSNDGGITFTENEILITPDAEEIEIICSSEEDESASSTFTGEGSLPDVRQVFSINTPVAKLALLVNGNPNATYSISYRLKHTDIYGKEFSMPADTSFGYYTEKAFSDIGSFLPIVKSNTYSQNLSGGYIAIYASNIITLTISPNAYSNEIARIDLGDLLGVDTVALSNAFAPVLQLFVGANRQYEYFAGNALTLGGTLYINLNNVQKMLGGTPCKNGNTFFLHFKQLITQGTFTIRIVQDYVSPSSYTLIKEFSANDFIFLQESEQGLFFRVTYTGTQWIINSTNEVSLITATPMDLELFYASVIADNPQSFTINENDLPDNTNFHLMNALVFLNKSTDGNFDNGANWNSFKYIVPTGGFTGSFLLSPINLELISEQDESGGSGHTNNFFIKTAIVKNGNVILASSDNTRLTVNMSTDPLGKTYLVEGVNTGSITLAAGDVISAYMYIQKANLTNNGAAISLQVNSGNISNQD